MCVCTERPVSVTIFENCVTVCLSLFQQWVTTATAAAAVFFLLYHSFICDINAADGIILLFVKLCAFHGYGCTNVTASRFPGQINGFFTVRVFYFFHVIVFVPPRNVCIVHFRVVTTHLFVICRVSDSRKYVTVYSATFEQRLMGVGIGPTTSR